MSSYNELIKNFDKIRSYMRDFYVYGFKSRTDYNFKSARSYDDERRRIESWLGDYMNFVRTLEGKNVFISIDSQTTKTNPLYNAFKAKSFTDKDITLHFILLDILYDPSIKLTLTKIIDNIYNYLSGFEYPINFDESTIRKKLKEYDEIGLIESVKEGRKVYYKRRESYDIKNLNEALHFYSEIAPCGVIGSFLLDKKENSTDYFTFKHHYITSTLDSDILSKLLIAISGKNIVTVTNKSRKKSSLEPKKIRLIPLRVLASVQNGRQHLIGYNGEDNTFYTLRIDSISSVKIEEVSNRFDEIRALLDSVQSKTWGVNCPKGLNNIDKTERVEFIIKVDADEDYIIRRLYREKRIGKVEKLEENVYKFSAEIYDTSEMIPWIRTFICRIVSVNFSNKNIENKFKNDIEDMYKLYGIGEVEE